MFQDSALESSLLDTNSNSGITNETVNTDSNSNASEGNIPSRASENKRKKKPAKRTLEDSVMDAENKMLEDAIELMRKQDQCSNDPYVAFGMHIAAELRKYDTITLTRVKHSINNIIYEADMGYLQQQTLGYHEERRPGYFTSQLTDLSDSTVSNHTDTGSGLTQLIRDLDT